MLGGSTLLILARWSKGYLCQVGARDHSDMSGFFIVTTHGEGHVPRLCEYATYDKCEFASQYSCLVFN